MCTQTHKNIQVSIYVVVCTHLTLHEYKGRGSKAKCPQPSVSLTRTSHGYPKLDHSTFQSRMWAEALFSPWCKYMGTTQGA